MKLLSVYSEILEYGSMKADKDGFIKNGFGNGNEPIIIDGKQLVLPYPGQLKNFNPEEKIIFHPMAENIFKGESEVIKLLKRKIYVKANITVCYLMQTLINILASTDLHSQMNPEQAQLFNMGIDADLKTLSNFVKVMTNGLKNKDEKGFVSVYLNRGGTFEGQRRTRVSVVTFPFYEQLTKEKEVPNGIPIDHLRNKDRECFKKLFEFIFPDISKPEAYNYGSNNNTIPYLDALMMGSATVTARLNDLINVYSNYIDSYDDCLFSSDWIESMSDISSLKSEILRIPVQYDNEGTMTPQAVTEPVATQPQMPVMNTQQMPQMAPAQPAPVKAGGKVSFTDAIASNGIANQAPMQQMYPPQQMMPQQMYPHQMPMHQGYPPQQMMPQQPMYPNQVPMQQMYPQQSMMQQPMYHNQVPMQQMYPQQPMQARPMSGWPEPAVTGPSMFPQHGYMQR